MDVKCNKALSSSLELMLAYSGYAHIDRQWHLPSTSFRFNRLYLPEHGEAFLIADNETIVMQPGMAYLLPPGLPLKCCCETSMDKLFFHFNLFKPDHYDFFHGQAQVLQVPFPQEQLRDLIEHYHSERYLDSTVVHLHLYRILRDIQEKYGMTERVQHYSDHVQDTIAYIQENLSAALRVEDLAKRRFVSRSHLATLFLKEVGVTPGRYIDDQLAVAAQWYLDQTGDSIAEIARKLGFNDQFYFSRRFKELCGKTPRAYRKDTQSSPSAHFTKDPALRK